MIGNQSEISFSFISGQHATNAVDVGAQEQVFRPDQICNVAGVAHSGDADRAGNQVQTDWPPRLSLISHPANRA